MTESAIHNEALELLEQGQPLKALTAWRALMLADREGVQLHLRAAQTVLSADPLASVRSMGLSLAKHLLLGEPGETEVNELGALLQHWGEICLPEVPSRALQHFERAWSCGSNTLLNERLASLYARLGFRTGAYARATPPAKTDPWPQIPCAAHSCTNSSCTTPSVHGHQNDQTLTLNLLEHGRIWVQRHTNPWHHTHGIGVQDINGSFQRELCRQYPWAWPGCPHRDQFRDLAIDQLGHQLLSRPPALITDHPILAVAELSGEMFFHWQVEVLPRIGRCWATALEHWPELRLWHNGRKTPWVQESLKRLRIPEDRILSDVDHIQARLLIVPSFSGAFGQPASANLTWLERFWNLKTTERANESTAHLWLGREGAVRRPVLGLAMNPLRAATASGLEQQWREMQPADSVIAAHGAAMTRILGCRKGMALTELVNPCYRPPYFQPLITHRQLHHQCLDSAPTPLPLQEWFYEGPMAFPIDLRPGRSAAADALRK